MKEARVIQLFNLIPDARYNNTHRGRVYDPDGIAPTVYNYAGGGGRHAKIIEYGRVYNGSREQAAQPHRGMIDGISPTITSACGCGGGMTPMLTDATIDECKTKEFYKQMRRPMSERAKEKKKFTLPPELEGKKFRIRKLTPRECFRLMDVDDADIDKIQASGISNSGQYKLAGNSIVVNVLYHLFRKLLVETGQDTKNGEPIQLSLF